MVYLTVKSIWKSSCILERNGAAVWQTLKSIISSVALTYAFIVVLLDEADVFLEQRSMHNLERNALVSGLSQPADSMRSEMTHHITVFLRVLEYYDGSIFKCGPLFGITY